jgi:predicted DNA-binding ribbon-helix-helix protein
MKRVRTEIRLPEPLYEVLREIAHRTKCSLNQLMIEQLMWMNREELLKPKKAENQE